MYCTVQTIFYIVSEDENQPKKLVQMEAIAPGTGDGSKGGVGEGELWIGGIGVAAGYLNASDLTKEVRMCYELNLFSLFTSASIFFCFLFFSKLCFFSFFPFAEISCNMTILRDKHMTSHLHRNSFRIPLGQDLYTAQGTL